jgi:hypothetical protein
MADEEVLPQEKERKARELPSVTELKPDVRAKVMALMDELADVTVEANRLNTREAQLKKQLDTLRDEAGQPGFRYANLSFQAIRVSGRRTLDKWMLLENGCPSRVLDASYKEGKPSLRLIFKDTEE